MTRAIDLAPAELAMVRDILRTHLPPGTQVWVFGSRATGGARRYSDLDLALDQGNPLGQDVLGAVTDALSESDLPFKVDVIDLRAIDSAFRSLIEADLIEFAV